jgi:hypothetical protein
MATRHLFNLSGDWIAYQVGQHVFCARDSPEEQL